jgi:3'-phosphoadenosine 5'-phosphosulfate sulfotransferase (PAPS reductase)/FAD synthetase
MANRQLELLRDYEDYSNMNILIGLSGGINSMAVLCYLSEWPDELKPKELHLFYAHFEEHSPDTLDFVLMGLEFAKKNFKNVFYKQTNNSVLDFFKVSKMIPHPMVAPCTRVLKIIPMSEYAVKNKIDLDLIGYIRSEAKRIKNMHKRNNKTKDTKGFPISHLNDEFCFAIVDEYIKYHPKIYDIKDKNGKRIFSHNNCLPCKNMQTDDILAVKKYYPELYKKALKLSSDLQSFWGRDEAEFYTTFGRDLGQEKQPCEICNFD